MSKRNRILMVILVVQALLLVAARFMPDAQDKAAETVTILAGFTPDQVTGIKIHGAKKSGEATAKEVIALAKNGGSWGVANADNYPAKGDEVSKALALLKRLKSRTKVLDQKTYHEKLEVSEAAYQRKVDIDQGGKTTTLFLGSSPSFKTAHVRVSGQDEVYQVSDLSTYDLDARATKWIERAYVDVEEAQLWAVTVKNQHGVLQLEKSPVTSKWIVVGLEGEPDEAKIKTLLGKARKVNLEAPVGKTIDKAYGLDAPMASVTLVYGESGENDAPPAAPQRLELAIGKKHADKDHYYAKGSHAPYVVEVTSWAIKPLLEQKISDFVPQAPKVQVPNTRPPTPRPPIPLAPNGR